MQREQLWDHAAFKRWVEDGARKKDMTIEEVCSAVGVSRFYFSGVYKPNEIEGPSANILLNLAKLFDASPAELLRSGSGTHSDAA